MAVVIPFQDIVRARRRRRHWAHLRACIEIIEASLALEQIELDNAEEAERPVHARRVQQLSALRDYAVNIL